MSPSHRVLLPHHAGKIRAAGISDAVRDTRGYFSATTATELLELGVSRAQAIVPALVIPIIGPAGEVVGYQSRPDKPRVGTNGKPIKYETPAGSRMHLDVPPGAWVNLGNPAVPLIVTEGVLKADAGITTGLCCIALLGVWNWRGTSEAGGKVALGEWEMVALNGRDVYIVFDSDVVTKREVRAALERLAGFLRYREAKVVTLKLPVGEGGSKTGLDDFLAAGHTAIELFGLPQFDGAEATFDASKASSGIVLVAADSIAPERVRWAWDQRIPIGMTSLLVGQGGLGKSLQICWLAAVLSRGTIPGDFFDMPIHVAIASAEDHRQAVILPRLMAAGADLSRIHFIEQHIDGDATDIEIDGEVADLELALVAGDVRALLVDTVIAHIPRQHDSYKEQHVRRVLKPIGKMAERLNLMLLGTMHLNRREARDVLTRISGSGGFGNLARSVLLFAQDPDDPDGPTRILALGKTNVGGVPCWYMRPRS